MIHGALYLLGDIPVRESTQARIEAAFRMERGLE